MQENTNCYRKQQPLQRTIIVPTRTIPHPRLYFIIIRYLQDIPNKLFNSNKAKQVIQRHSIIVTGTDYDHILDEIERREKLSLNGMLMLIGTMNSIDDNNNNAIFNVVLQYIIIK